MNDLVVNHRANALEWLNKHPIKTWPQFYPNMPKDFKESAKKHNAHFYLLEVDQEKRDPVELASQLMNESDRL